MSNIVDFNKEKSKIEDKKQAEAKRKMHNDKVIKKVKRNITMSNVNVWKFYGGILIVIAIVVVIFK